MLKVLIDCGGHPAIFDLPHKRLENSDYMLSLKRAKIYDIASVPAEIKRWIELESVRTYHDFFKEHEGDFK